MYTSRPTVSKGRIPQHSPLSNPVLIRGSLLIRAGLCYSHTFTLSVGRDDKMIPAAFPTERAVIGIDIASAKRRPFTVGGTMNDDQRDVAHEREGF